jgi:IS30 family transposase
VDRPSPVARQRAGSAVPDATLIHDRPVAVELRERLGDREGDLVIGRGNRSAVATLMDRRTRLLRLIRFPTATTARKACARIARVMWRYQPT